MTRDEAINNLNDLWNEVYNEDSDGYVYAEAIDIAIESLQNEVSYGEWIPVTDKLPEKSGQYLVFYHGMLKHNFIDLMWYGKPLMPNRCISRKKKYFYRSDSEWGDVIYDEVIAWMPLPDPYKGE